MSNMIGSFAELNSGGPVPFVAQLIDWNPSGRSFLCKWLWRPQDLPETLLCAPRTLASFARQELLMCTTDPAGADWNPRDALLREHVQVLTYSDWLKQGDFTRYFYRQIYDVSARVLLLADAAELELVQLADGSQQVVNPDIRYFRCPLCLLLFDGGCLGIVNPGKTKPSDPMSPHECTVCIQKTWKSKTPPSDEKRHAVVERLTAGLKLAIEEVPRVPSFLGIPDAAVALASAIEQRLVDDLGLLSKEYKAQARALIFNLTDPKNPNLRALVISGDFPFWRLTRATADELASQSTQQTREAEREKYYHDQVLLSATSEATQTKADSDNSPSPRRQISLMTVAADGSRPELTRKRGDTDKIAKTLLAELVNLDNTEIAERLRKFITFTCTWCAQGTTTDEAGDSVSVLVCHHSYHRRCLDHIRTAEGHFCSECNRVIFGAPSPIYLTYDCKASGPAGVYQDSEWALARKELACISRQLPELEDPVREAEASLEACELEIRRINAEIQDLAKTNSVLSAKERELIEMIRKAEQELSRLETDIQERFITEKVLNFYEVLRSDGMAIQTKKETLNDLIDWMHRHEFPDHAADLFHSAFIHHSQELMRKQRERKTLDLQLRETYKENQRPPELKRKSDKRLPSTASSLLPKFVKLPERSKDVQSEVQDLNWNSALTLRKKATFTFR